MRGIKIPQYEFALKLQGGLMREGGRICGTLRYHHFSFTDSLLHEREWIGHKAAYHINWPENKSYK